MQKNGRGHPLAVEHSAKYAYDLILPKDLTKMLGPILVR
jgi:hypothetical protein